MSGTPASLATAAMLLMSVTMPPGLAIDSTKIALVLGVSAARNVREHLELRGERARRRAERGRVSRIGPLHLPAAFLEGMGELIDRTAIELASGDELIAGREQSMEHERLRRVAGGYGKARRAAFERCDPLLEHGLSRVRDAGVDVAEGLEVEQRGRVLDVVEDERRRLVDRRGAGASRWIGVSAGVDRKRVEAGLSLRGHCHVPFIDLRAGL